MLVNVNWRYNKVLDEGSKLCILGSHHYILTVCSQAAQSISKLLCCSLFSLFSFLISTISSIQGDGHYSKGEENPIWITKKKKKPNNKGKSSNFTVKYYINIRFLLLWIPAWIQPRLMKWRLRVSTQHQFFCCNFPLDSTPKAFQRSLDQGSLGFCTKLRICAHTHIGEGVSFIVIHGVWVVLSNEVIGYHFLNFGAGLIRQHCRECY